MSELPTLFAVITSAIGDSFNPCAIAVLVFIVSFLIEIKKRGKDFLLLGGVYIFSVYITYFLGGLVIYQLIDILGLSDIIYTIAAILVILAGIINLKDVFFKGKGFSLSVPASRMKIVQKYIKKATVPAALILGMLVSLIELPCTGGLYFSTISLLAKKETFIIGLLYLLVYNLIFVMPLIIILIIAHFSLSYESINSWRKKNKTWMKFIMGAIMLFLGTAMLLESF